MKIQEFSKHLDEPREIGKKKDRLSSKEKTMVKKQLGEHLGITTEQAKQILDNMCVECGNLVDENLKKWFSDKWVNIGKKKKGGGHPPCGTSGDKRAYAKCVPKSKAANMSKKQKASATRRKRSAQNQANRGGKKSAGQGKAPIRVSTKPEK
tara:strand:+ start:1213 stop:1668 length:456 start_codon:yes stop_codon:yes gene_type:complete